MNNKNLPNLPPLSLYVHIPFCKKKCPYCDFNSFVISENFSEKDYFELLFFDFEKNLKYIKDRKLISIFFGGGTPSLFQAEYFETFIFKISKLIEFEKNIEITVEVNPESLKNKNLNDYRNAGINRISLGAQSFDNINLKNLGRLHESKDIFDSIEKIKLSKFKNFNIDLMYGLENQTIKNALDDLKRAINFNPTHISWYNLTIEKNTFFAKNPPILPDLDYLFLMMNEGKAFLKENLFNQYEVSAYAKKSFNCIHNLNYWKYGDYLGIGAFAHSKITTINGEIFRIVKSKNLKDYFNKKNDFVDSIKKLANNDLIFEFMLNNLRLISGFAPKFFTARTFLDFNLILDKINLAVDKGLIKFEKDIVKPTNLGNLFLNDLCQIFI